MPRPPRDAAPGLHHIGVGAAGPAPYFRDDVDHLTWTRFFAHTIDRYGWTCIAVCELSTHWHAILDVPDDTLPRGLHWLNSEYGKAFNARHGRVGYLVRDRYWSRRKATDAEALTAFRYVSQNPVNAGVADRPEDWFWSSFATTIGLATTFPFVDATLVLMQFGTSHAVAIPALRRFVEEGL